PARMVAVAMGDNCEIQLPQVDALGLDIVRENLRVVAGIKQDPLAAILDKRGKSPILRHRRGLAEGVVKNRDLRGARFRVCRMCADRCRRNHQRSNFKEDMASHRMLPRTNSGARREVPELSSDIMPARVKQRTVARGTKNGG